MGDVRGVLQYVPLFRGRTFVVLFDEGLLPEPAVAETLLDLKALQDVGVRLVIGVLGGDVDDLAAWLTELEVKFARAAAPPRDAEACLAECGRIIERGQAAVVDCAGVSPLGARMAALGSGLGAAKLIALLNGPGVLRDGKPLHAISCSAAESVDGPLRGGELLSAAVGVCQSGIPRVHILDGRQQGVLADELFSNEGAGTMVHTDSYREIRPLREEDIPELLAMVGRSVRRSHLVPRGYEDIEEKTGDFSVMCLDDNVVGCVALHEYGGDLGEIACLYVKQSHEKLGYGRTLVQTAEEKARARGLKTVFALTNRAAGFFGDKLGFTEGDLSIVPAARRAKLAD
ncbi:MAG: GNAT family N-acetyltransferase, partial [Akkermansiaceae bacterium]|nr:GNAT family N-acetyltransferase [Akkermansiaceae bacterium]